MLSVRPLGSDVLGTKPQRDRVDGMTQHILCRGQPSEWPVKRRFYERVRPVTGGSSTSNSALLVNPARMAPTIGASQNSQSC